MVRRRQQAPAMMQPPVEEDDSMDVDVAYVKLRTNDGKYFDFTEAEASCSNALKRMLESSRNCSNNHSDHNSSAGRADCIQLQSIDSKVLANIQQWCKMHSRNQSTVSNGYNMNGNEHEAESDSWIRDQDDHNNVGPREQVAESWDMTYLASFSEVEILRLTSAANFLDVKDLYDSCCRFMANKWEGMKVEEIRRAYNIRDDFAADEEIQIIQENKRIGLTE